jgi:hypothetical protein
MLNPISLFFSHRQHGPPALPVCNYTRFRQREKVQISPADRLPGSMNLPLHRRSIHSETSFLKRVPNRGATLIFRRFSSKDFLASADRVLPRADA